MFTQSRIEKAIVAVISGLISAALVAWLLMLGLGAAHSMSPEIPAPGYWNTFAALVFFETYLEIRHALVKGREARKAKN